MILGCVCLLFHAAVVVALGVRNAFRLPANFGYFSMLVYGLYLILAVALQFLTDSPENNDATQCV